MIRNQGGKVALFFLDAEKALDKIHWTFMKLLIKKLQLGNFENAIQAIYSKQMASIEINNDLSKQINIQKRNALGVSPLHCCL